jgi:hypothetical protein
LIFQLTFNYKNNSPVSLSVDSQEKVDDILTRIRDSQSDVVSVDTDSGGVLVRKSELISPIKVTQISEGGGIVSENDEILGPITPEVLPPESDIGNLPVQFSSFREKIVGSILKQRSWMDDIVEKNTKREQLLQKVASKLDNDNKKMETVLKDEFGE